MTTISIIGGSGFIGSRLVHRLTNQKNHNIRIFDKAPSLTFPQLCKVCDVRNIESLKGTLPEESTLINLAAEHRDDVQPRSLYHDVNVTGAANLCQVAREKNIKTIIFTSTVAVYGFAPLGTNETGQIAPFNDYGRTKYQAEQIFKAWQAELPAERTLVIIRPTVVFGEQNRGNVYNLLRQIASGKFLMVGNGENRKSMAYVENLAAFIEHSINFQPGVHTYNFIDKPDFTMNELVGSVKRTLGQPEKIGFRLPYSVGYAIGKCFDLLAAVTGKRLAISSIRVKKFCANSVYSTAIDSTGFVSPVPLTKALEQTIRHEFIEKHDDQPVYFSE
ncbi:MAG: NAD-dependent epimerase/dehydratase family protein [Limnobacter sp.]|uniref:NAD-dependent epimerase/dehydratase family protein n=1 Tax=Limnobacter sp. TaxID=2003368 RepID=UPI0032ECA69E